MTEPPTRIGVCKAVPKAKHEETPEVFSLAIDKKLSANM